jgi:hypothetical protein
VWDRYHAKQEWARWGDLVARLKRANVFWKTDLVPVVGLIECARQYCAWSFVGNA